MAFIHNKKGELEWLTSPLLTAHGVTHCFTTRRGGVSEGCYSSLSFRTHCDDTRENLIENYRRISDACGFDAEKAVLCRQVHGTRVYKVTADDAGKGFYRENDFGDADGLMTKEKHIPLICFMADCVPILLYDSVTGACAAVHSGWRGTAGAIAVRAIEEMNGQYGTKAENIVAAIGPSIGQCCFEVGHEVRDAFDQELHFAFKDNARGRLMCDLWAINTRLLEKAGVKSENIDVARECTACNGELYFSHRATMGKRGNMLAAILATDK